MEQELRSIGIDVGTSTTQVVFCSLHLKEETGYGRAPRAKITEKKVLYRGKIWNTMLRDEDEIDGNAVAEIVKKEYQNAGFLPEEIHTGAVIITGESARKRNARGVIEALSKLAGEFIAMEAGPDMESILAGKGAGTDLLSVQTGKIAVNLDIGGGTTNICVFQDGEVVDCACLNVGGRLLKLEDHKVKKLEQSMKIILNSMNIFLEKGKEIQVETAEKICTRMAELIEEALGFRKKTELLNQIITNHGLSGKYFPDILTFSGGVADCLDSTTSFRYNDLGDIFGRILNNRPLLRDKIVPYQHETIRATVIGAGSYSVEISGSTVDYQDRKLPLCNLQVLHLTWEKAEDLEWISIELRRKKELMIRKNQDFAVWMRGSKTASFIEIQEVEELLSKEKYLRVVILERDLGKALGQALKRRIGAQNAPVCIDEIHCGDGDYIDVGKPVGRGNALQVVIKTLIFD